MENLNDFSILASRDGGTRKFTKMAWNYLPKDKNGWKIVPPESSVESVEESDEVEVDSTPAPPESDNSSNYTLDELSVKLKEFKTEIDIAAFMEGEKRSGAKKMAAMRTKEVTN